MSSWKERINYNAYRKDSSDTSLIWNKEKNLNKASAFLVRKLHGLLIPDYRSLTHPLTLIRDSERNKRLV